MAFTLDTPLTSSRKIDKTRQKALKKLGLNTILDLLFYWPARYEDLSKITKISQLKPNTEATISGQLISLENRRSPLQHIPITEGLVSDQTGTIKIVWFNQLYLKKYFQKGETYILHGKIEYGQGLILQLTSPSFEKFKEFSIHIGRIVPIYPETKNITSKWLRYMIWPHLKFVYKIPDFLPPEITRKQNLMPRYRALWQIHFPDNFHNLERARERLAFDELFLIQALSQSQKKEWQKNKAFKIKFNKELIKKFVDALPFKLTNTQKISAWEILQDLEKEKPMNRLLEGDVGSGKTVVAAIAGLQTINNGNQAAFMAPTEILAFQHFKNIYELFRSGQNTNCHFDSRWNRDEKSRSYEIPCLAGRRARLQSPAATSARNDTAIKIALFTHSSTKVNNKEVKKDNLIRKIKNGEISFIIGTHSLIEEKIKFKNLALAIIDEQHRFGVKQRKSLIKINKNGCAPHLLSMTATPIPRTLALAFFGDLDLSVLTEMPKGRKKIITKIVEPENRDGAYDFIREKAKAHEQTFVICPQIFGNGKLEAKAVEAEYKKLKENIFPNLKIAMLHGKLKKDEKEKIMDDFGKGKTNLLVSTSVVEVGVDIPAATIMMIESAERFGLAQLHQLRGRVGRRENQAYCLLFTESSSEKITARLSALITCENGFQLAEKDLELRGPGELYGIKQWGLPDLKIASLTDYDLIKRVKLETDNLLAYDPELKKFPLLRGKLNSFGKIIHLE